MNGDPVQPGLQAAFTVEALHAAKDLQKNFLRSVRGVAWVSKNAVYQAVNWLVIVRDEPVVSVLGAGFQFGHDGGFFGSYTDRADNVTQCCYSRHFSHGVTPIFSGYGRRYNSHLHNGGNQLTGYSNSFKKIDPISGSQVPASQEFLGRRFSEVKWKTAVKPAWVNSRPAA